MDRCFKKVIDSASGEGRLYDGSEFVDEVSYVYSILQSFTEVQMPGENHVVPGVKELDGMVQLKGIDGHLDGKDYRLETTEGVVFDITIHKTDYESKRYAFSKAVD